jgi:hypothetical protein
MVRMLASAALVLGALAASLSAQQTRPAGPVVNPLTDSNVYPVAVWAMGSRTAPAFAAMGVNIFVGGEDKDAAHWCDELAKSGCAGFVGWRNRTPEELVKIAASPGFLGWMHGDEPDNAGEVNGEYRSTHTPPAELIAAYQAMKASKAPAPMYLNLGQGLANANWQSTPDELYREFMKCADVVCYDIYPTTMMPDGPSRLALVARGMSRLKAFAGPRPAWIWLECTNMPADKADVGERAPYPHELRAEVWMSVLHGADGIGYFPHQFTPYKGGPAAIPQELQKEIKLTNSLLHKLAPVLRTGKKELLKVEAGKGRVDAAMWNHNTGYLLLAVNMNNAPARAKIALPAGKWSFRVIGQDRRGENDGGFLTDDFQPYEVRLYWGGPKIEGFSYAYPTPPALPAFAASATPGKPADLPILREAGKGLAWSRTHHAAVDAFQLEEAPTIDGKLDDKAWAGATKLVNWSNVAGTGVAACQTTGWVGQKDGKMYMAFRCDEPNMDKLVTGKKAGWQNDCIEIWFDPTDQRKSYSHVVVTADGQVEASRTVPDANWLGEGTRDDGWKPSIQVKTGREEKAWTVELAIDIKDLELPNWNYKYCAFNVARERKAGAGENSMYFSGGFNKPFRFGTLHWASAFPMSLSNGVLLNRSPKPVRANVEVSVYKKLPGIIFPTWEAKWSWIAYETKNVDLAPGQVVNLLDESLGQRVPSGGRVRLDAAIADSGKRPMLVQAVTEEFIANEAK